MDNGKETWFAEPNYCFKITKDERDTVSCKGTFCSANSIRAGPKEFLPNYMLLRM